MTPPGNAPIVKVVGRNRSENCDRSLGTRYETLLRIGQRLVTPVVQIVDRKRATVHQ